MQFHKIWVEQCDATEDIKNRFSAEDALRYLVGEKFLTYLRECDHRPDFRSEVPSFVARIHSIFTQAEIADLFDELLAGESADDDEDWPFDSFEDAELDARDLQREAEQIVLIGRARDLLLT